MQLYSSTEEVLYSMHSAFSLLRGEKCTNKQAYFCFQPCQVSVLYNTNTNNTDAFRLLQPGPAEVHDSQLTPRHSIHGPGRPETSGIASRIDESVPIGCVCRTSVWSHPLLSVYCVMDHVNCLRCLFVFVLMWQSIYN